ncbi:MAG: hypothetical protein Q4F97_02870 [Bacteroidales bacterium]|nr:hypothetical protein [Bacteroidales bacterium]
MKRNLHSFKDGLSLSVSNLRLFKALFLTCAFLLLGFSEGKALTGGSLEDGKTYTIFDGESSNYLVINSTGSGVTKTSTTTGDDIKWLAKSVGNGYFTLENVGRKGNYLYVSGSTLTTTSTSYSANGAKWTSNLLSKSSTRYNYYLYYKSSNFTVRNGNNSNLALKEVDVYIFTVSPISDLSWNGDDITPKATETIESTLNKGAAGGDLTIGNYSVKISGMSDSDSFEFDSATGKIAPKNYVSSEKSETVTLTIQATLNGKVVATKTAPITLKQKAASYIIQTLSAQDLSFVYNTTSAQSPTVNGVLYLKKSDESTIAVTGATFTVKSISNVTGDFKVSSTTKIAPTGTNSTQNVKTGTALLNVDANYNGAVVASGVVSVNLEQKANKLTLQHRNPYPSSYTDGISGLQPTHINYRTVYAKPGTSKSLDASGAEAYVNAYTRWFDYDNEKSGLAFSNAGRETDKGYVTLGPKISVSYTLPNGQTSHKIAADMSDYQDYNNSTLISNGGSGVFTEPTLSYRWLFDVRDAQEMIDKFAKLGNTDYLEEYEITAPESQSEIILKPQYTSDNYWGSGYKQGTFAWSSSSNSSNTVSKNTGDMYYSFTAGTAGNTKEVTLTMTADGVNYRVARFKVKFVADAAPMTDANITSNERKLSVLDDANGDFVRLATLNFDNNTQSGTSGIGTKPLGWDESSYGFYYRGLVNPTDKKAGNNIPEWSEYAFVQSSKALCDIGASGFLSSGVIDHSNPNGGFFVYVDASQKPGTVANLKFDQALCQNMKLKVVAYVTNLNKNSGSTMPNLNLVLKGKSNNGTETVLHRFTTGKIPSTSSWHQVCYDVMFSSNQDFDYYTLQVDNNGTSSTGNDFALDDIRIYRTKTSAESWQKGPECDKKVPVYIELDNEKLISQLPAGTAYLNYRFIDDKGGVVNCDYYKFNNKPATTFGTLQFKDGEFVAPEGSGVSLSNGKLTFTQESSNFTVGKKYYLVLNASQQELENPIFESDTRCGWAAGFSIESSIDLTIDGDIYTSTTVENFCNSSEVEISAVVKGSYNNRIVTVDCPFDWYIGNADDDTKALIKAFQDNRNNPSAQITALVNEGKLILNKKSIKYRILSNQQFTIFPVSDNATIVGQDGTPILCDNPVVITVNRGGGSGVLVFGEKNVTYPSDYEFAVRLSKTVANGQAFDAPIKEISSSINSIKEIMIISSTDSEAPIGTVLKGNFIISSDKSKLSLIFLSSNLFKEGYEYKLWVSFADGSLCGGSANLILKIVPEYAIWKGTNNDWNDDSNWGTASVNGMTVTEVTGNGIKGFVPLNFTNVTLPEKTGLVYPSLVEASNNGEIDTWGEVKDIYYDYNYDGNVCKYIYFQPGSELARTDLLKKEKVWIDQRVKVNRWYMLSAPLQDMYTGDMHLPKNGVYKNSLFQDLDQANSRTMPFVYQQVFARTVANKLNSGTNETYIAGSDWTASFNALNFKHNVGTGYRLGVLAEGDFSWIGSDETVVFKFPKIDETYRYYTDAGIATSLSENAPKNNQYEFAFNPAEGTTSQTITVSKEVESDAAANENTIFLVGNPFMAHLNFEKFYEANRDKITPTFWIYNNSNDKVYTCNKENDKWIYTSKEGTVDEINGNIAPTQSFFIEGKGNLTTTEDGISYMNIDLVFDADMMTIDNTPAAALKAKADKVNPDNQILRITANRGDLESTLAVVCKDGAKNGYEKGEDVLTLLETNSEITPVVYSIADNNALSITTVNGDVLVPIAIYTQTEGAVNVKFNGMDSFTYPIYLYDSEKNVKTELTEENSEIVLNVDKTQIDGNYSGRYYIQFRAATGIEDVKDSAINAYSPSEGVMVVQSELSDPIASVEVYTTDGKLIASRKHINDAIARFDVASDNYIVKIQTEKQSVSLKVNVK